MTQSLDLFDLVHLIDTDNDPACEAEYRCTNPDCTECNQPVRLCPQPATDRVTATCAGSSCTCRIVMLLCTSHADQAMTEWPNAIDRRPL